MKDHNSPTGNKIRRRKKHIQGRFYDTVKMRNVPLIEKRDFIKSSVETFLANGGRVTVQEASERQIDYLTGAGAETDEFLQGET